MSFPGRPGAMRTPPRGRPAGFRGRLACGVPLGNSTLLDQYATEYWLASDYSGSGDWLGAKGVADLALPGGTNNPLFLPHSSASNPFGAGVDYVSLPGTAGNCVLGPNSSTWFGAGANTSFDFRFEAMSYDWTSTQYLWGTRYQAIGARVLYIGINATGKVIVGTGQSDGDVQDATSTTPLGFTDGTVGQIRVVWSSAGTVAIYKRTGNSEPLTSDASWTTVDTGLVGGTDMDGVAEAMVVGGFYDLTDGNTWNGLISRARFIVDSVMVGDFNPNGGTFDTTETTLTGTGDGLTWTIKRSASGRRAWAITRDAWSFGADDYLSVADNALFDFGASQDFTVAALFRAIQDADSNYHTLVSKRDGTSDTEGWSISVAGSGTATEFYSIIEIANTATVITDATWNNPGQLQTHIDTRIADVNKVYTDAVEVATASALSGSLENSTLLRVGGDTTGGTGASYYEGLIHGLAISRTGLSAGQVTTLDTELRALS